MNFKDKLENGKFCFTAELFPPKGTDLSVFKQKAELLKEFIDAFNVTDNQRAVMRLGGIAVAKTLIDMGIEPIWQLTCRDRNRLALQSDILAAYVLGIRNILIIGGDHPSVGDHKAAMPVYDLDTVQLISVTQGLNSGYDMNGKTLKGKPDFFIGAVVNPNLEPVDLQLAVMKKKINAGAKFFQSQVCFDPERIVPFLNLSRKYNVKFLVSLSLFSTAEQMEQFVTLGIKIPEPLYKRIRGATSALNESAKVCSELIKELKTSVDGIHIIAINIEDKIPLIFSSI